MHSMTNAMIPAPALIGFLATRTLRGTLAPIVEVESLRMQRWSAKPSPHLNLTTHGGQCRLQLRRADQRDIRTVTHLSRFVHNVVHPSGNPDTSARATGRHDAPLWIAITLFLCPVHVYRWRTTITAKG